jgi:hypothetical protein
MGIFRKERFMRNIKGKVLIVTRLCAKHTRSIKVELFGGKTIKASEKFMAKQMVAFRKGIISENFSTENGKLAWKQREKNLSLI